MKKGLIILALVVATIGGGAALYAGPGRAHFAGHGDGHEFGILGHLHRIAGQLDLTDEQKTQIHAIFRETREQNREIRMQLHGGYKDAAKTLIANPNDLAAAQAQLDRQLETERALKTSILQGASKALNVLTPEQRTKLALLLAEHAGERANRRK
jgi:Spy/CpxP family protein refolding chaperone